MPREQADATVTDWQSRASTMSRWWALPGARLPAQRDVWGQGGHREGEGKDAARRAAGEPYRLRCARA